MAARKTYTAEQKAEILKRAAETSIAAASKEFNVARLTIAKWKAAADTTAVEIEAKKTVRKTAKQAKEKVTSAKAKAGKKAAAKKAEAKEVKEAVAAEVKEAKTAAKAKAGRKAAAKKAEAKEVKEAVAAEVKDAKTAVEIEAKKTTRKVAKKAKETVAEPVKAQAKRAAAAKLNLVFQSTMGGAVTPEQIAEKLPKEATDAYVKIEENKIYYVLKSGETGSVEIW